METNENTIEASRFMVIAKCMIDILFCVGFEDLTFRQALSCIRLAKFNVINDVEEIPLNKEIRGYPILKYSVDNNICGHMLTCPMQSTLYKL